MCSFLTPSSLFFRLAAGSLAGHLLECSAQSTGGLFTDWHLVNGWENMGYPIAECFPDGKFNITKPPGTGGLVSVPTVAEQLVYEIGNPKAYMLPDVTCDFSNVSMKEIEPNVVQVTGAKGYAPTEDFKVCATYADGYRLTSVVLCGGKNAIPKGKHNSYPIYETFNFTWEIKTNKRKAKEYKFD